MSMTPLPPKAVLFLEKLSWLPFNSSSIHIMSLASVLCKCLCMSQQLGNEVERQGKARQTSQLHPGQLRRAALGGIRTHDTLQSRRALYQLSYQGNSAGRGSNLQHNTTQGKSQTTVLWLSKLSPSMYMYSLTLHSVAGNMGNVQDTVKTTPYTACTVHVPLHVEVWWV